MASTLARRLALLAIIALLGACAGLGGRVENPRVTVTSLRVLNPNDFDLDAKGLVISLGINDVPLLNGATADVPLVPAYGEALAKLTLSVNLVSGLRLVSRLVQRPDDPLQYRLEARLDLRSPMWKRLTVMEQGEISPRPPASVNDSTNRGNTF